MKINLDACSLIHLSQGAMLDIVLALEGYAFFVGPLVRGEVKQLKAALDEHINLGEIRVLPDDELTLDEVADFADRNNLGLGESECILFGHNRGDLNVCSDDRRARRIAETNLSEARVLGTADLLRICIRQALLTPQDAFAAYELMRARGAFLPALSRESFII